MSPYVFVDGWRVAAAPAAVWRLVRRVDGWPDWWPSVRSVEPVPGRGEGSETWRFTFATRLPYAMVFDAAVVADEPGVGVETQVSGRVEGSGRWGVRPVDGGTLVRFDWSVRPTLRWMQVLSPVARPAFAWNHRALMVEGGRALARRLDSRLLEPVVSELLADGSGARSSQPG